MRKLDLANKADFDEFAKRVGKRTAKAIRFGITYGIPYNGPGSSVPNRPGAYGCVSSAEFSVLWMMFGTKPRER